MAALFETPDKLPRSSLLMMTMMMSLDVVIGCKLVEYCDCFKQRYVDVNFFSLSKMEKVTKVTLNLKE